MTKTKEKYIEFNYKKREKEKYRRKLLIKTKEKPYVCNSLLNSEKQREEKNEGKGAADMKEEGKGEGNEKKNCEIEIRCPSWPSDGW